MPDSTEPAVLPASTIIDFNLKYPPLPRTIAEVTRLMRAEEPDPQALARVVSADPAVAAMLLRRINSVFYALRGRISDVPRVVTLLGFRETCHVALTAGMSQLQDALREPGQAGVYHELVRRSLGAAYYTHDLATYTALAPAPFAFTVGLLSTAGRMVLLYNWAQAYPVLWEGGRMPTAEEEREALGVGHAELGAQAALHWNLPEEIRTVLEAMDDLERATPELRPLVLALSVALDAAERLDGEGRAPGRRPSPPGLPSAVEMLAACTETTPEDLGARIEAHRERAREFVASMSA